MGALARALRPHPDRGDLIAAGVVALTVGVAMTELRFDHVWARGPRLLIALIGCALVLSMGMLARLEHESPRAYHSALLVAGLTLLAIVLLRFAQVLGVRGPLHVAGTRTWMAALLALVALYAARRSNSAICTLIAAVAAGVAALAFVSWAFKPHGLATLRWILLVLLVAYGVGALRLRERSRRHSVALVNAAGLATITLALTFLVAPFVVPSLLLSGDGAVTAAPGWGWKLVIAAAAFGLVAYGAVDGEPGPAYLGFLALALFTLTVARPGPSGASLIGWPILLLLAGATAIGFGLRTLRPLPPEPGDDRTTQPLQMPPRD
ncbi:MAG TPA: hypothetical protein VHE14_03610 [Solirubrobacteraceae bacterium]|nr:hypothetical protein [Solirubrobacteraceae bacterium]